MHPINTKLASPQIFLIPITSVRQRASGSSCVWSRTCLFHLSLQHESLLLPLRNAQKLPPEESRAPSHLRTIRIFRDSPRVNIDILPFSTPPSIQQTITKSFRILTGNRRMKRTCSNRWLSRKYIFVGHRKRIGETRFLARTFTTVSRWHEARENSE